MLQIWKDAIIKQLERIPLVRAFRLEVPENPSIGLRFKIGQLSTQIVPHVVLETITPGVNIGFAFTRADVGGIGVCAIVAGTETESIESPCAISHRSCEFADDGPFVGAGIGMLVGADVVDMLACAHGDERIGENLVFVMIDDDLGLLACA